MEKKELDLTYINIVNEKEHKKQYTDKIHSRVSTFLGILYMILILGFVIVGVVFTIRQRIHTEDNVTTPTTYTSSINVYVPEIEDIQVEKIKKFETYNTSPEPTTEEPTTECVENTTGCNWYIDYMAQCVMAEAGNQCDTGVRLVVDCILNRLDNDTFPDNIYDIINQAGQFEVVENGSINTIVPTQRIYDIIWEELENRYNSEVLYFRTLHYHTFGTPLFKVQDHYFSK